MLALAKTKDRSIRFLIPSDYTSLYNSLKNLLPEHYRLFAKPNTLGQTTTWYYEDSESIEGQKVSTYEELSSEAQMTVLDYLEDSKEYIIQQLGHDKFFSKYVKHLFATPSKSDIKVIETDFEPIVVLTQWACSPDDARKGITPLESILIMQENDRVRVKVDFRYTDETVAARIPFVFTYKEVVKEFKSKNDGSYSLGRIKLDSEFSIHIEVNGEQRHLHNFRVVKDGEYIVYLPLMVSGRAKVINQDKAVIPNADIQLSYGGEVQDYNTGKHGFLKVDNLEVGKTISIAEKHNPENTKTYTINKEQNEFVLEIKESVYADVQLKIMNQRDELLPKRSLLLEYEGKELEFGTRECNSGDSGIIELSQLLVGTQLKATEKDNLENVQTYKVEEQDNEFIFRIVEPDAPAPGKVRINLFEGRKKKKKMIANQELIIRHKGKEYKVLTDEEGWSPFEIEGLEDGDEIEIVTRVPKSKRYKRLKYIPSKK